MPDLRPLLALYDSPAAHRLYDESVSQLEHALQSAALAVEDGADDALVAASLLHDVGHLLTADERPTGGRPSDDLRHESAAGRHLRTWFGPEVTAPVVLHVAAKRYLCAVDEEYSAILSPGSVHSLRLQGGPMDERERADFESRRGWAEAVRLRRFDDGAKVVGKVVPPLEEYVSTLERLASIGG